MKDRGGLGGQTLQPEHIRPQRRVPYSQGGHMARCDFLDERPPTAQRIGREGPGGEERSSRLGTVRPELKGHGYAVAAWRPPASIREED